MSDVEFETGSPASVVEIVQALLRLHAESCAYLASLSTAQFFAPQGTAWSPADHVRHLTKSVRPVARAMRLPRFVLRLLFGASRRPSREFSSMREVYRAELEAGAGAGRFAPRPKPLPEDLERYRETLVEQWDAAVRELAMEVSRWPEASLDRCRLPHPILGKLTVREMLFFTVYHNAHHLRRVAERAKLD